MTFTKELKQYNTLDQMVCTAVGHHPYMHVTLKSVFGFIHPDEDDYDEACEQADRHVDNVDQARLLFEETRYIGKLSGQEYSTYAAMIEGEAVYFTTDGNTEYTPSKYHIRYKRTEAESHWSSNSYATWEEVIETAFTNELFQLENVDQLTAEEIDRVNSVRVLRGHLKSIQDTTQ